MIFQARAKILYHKKVGPRHYRLTLGAAGIAKGARPGQFVQIRVGDTFEPLLRRPFSIHRARKGVFEVLYEVVGQASEILSRNKRGEYLEIIGPLGHGFPLDGNNGILLLVGGGMGVAPLVFLAERLSQKNKNGIVLLGARDKKDILCLKEFRDLGFDVKISTDNGSLGFKGRVSELLKQELTTNCQPRQDIIIYACGPWPMLREITRLSRSFNIPAWISLEEHMACGLGACLGCVVETPSGYQRVCKEGPVFEAGEIIGENKSPKGGP